MKIVALAAFAAIAAASSAHAQGYPPAYPPAYPQPYPPQYRPYAAQGVLPPQAAIAVVRSMGYSPIGPAMFRGNFYAVRAIDVYGNAVRVAVNARTGNVMRIVAADRAPSRYAMAPRYPAAPDYDYPVPPRAIPSVPQSYDGRYPQPYGQPPYGPRVQQQQPPRTATAAPVAPMPRPKPPAAATPQTQSAAAPPPPPPVATPVTPGHSVPAPHPVQPLPPAAKPDTPLVPVAPLE